MTLRKGKKIDRNTSHKRSNPARILFINGWSSCHGGSSTSLLDIVSSLDRKRFEPLVLCPEPGPLPDRLKNINVPFVTRKFSSFSKTTVFTFLIEFFAYRQFLQKENISLIHGNTICWRKSVILAARWLNIPFIQHVRNIFRDYDSDFSLTYAKRIIVNSKYSGKFFLAHPKFRDKTQTIYNAFDLQLYESEDDRRAEIQAGDCPIIGFVGNLKPAKGTITLLRAMPQVLSQIPNAILVILGQAPKNKPEYENECRALVKELKIEESVIFGGFRKDVPAWMRTFNVFVLPTRSETFGKVIIEAMAAGCPVVTTNVGGIPEIISRPELGTMITPDDPDATAKEILRFLVDTSSAKKTAEAAKEYVQENFTLQTMMNKLMKMYDTILHECGKNGRA